MQKKTYVCLIIFVFASLLPVGGYGMGRLSDDTVLQARINGMFPRVAPDSLCAFACANQMQELLGALQSIITDNKTLNVADLRDAAAIVALRGDDESLENMHRILQASSMADKDRKRILNRALRCAAVQCFDSTMQLLMRLGADINHQGEDFLGTPPLVAVMAAGRIDRAVFLLKHGADPSAADLRYMTALHTAARLSNDDAALQGVRLLVLHVAETSTPKDVLRLLQLEMEDLCILRTARQLAETRCNDCTARYLQSVEEHARAY